MVAIIGILSAIAIPNYQRYQSRSRQSEAKVDLSSTYTAEQGFYAEMGTFSACIKRMGVMGDAVQRRYYSFGIYNGAAQNTCGPNGVAACLAYTYSGTSGERFCDASGGTIVTLGESVFNATASMNKNFTIIDLSGGSSYSDIINRQYLHRGGRG